MVNLDERDFSPAVLTAEQTVEILHIAQESLSNVRKHAHATRVQMSLSRVNEELRLEIADDGVGLDTARAPGTGFGWTRMRGRAEKLSGELHLAANAGGGTRLTLRVPAGSGGVMLSVRLGARS